MLSLEDCIALCDLTEEEEVLAIAEHEHIPEMAATERERMLVLKALLRSFVLEHPRCEERHRKQLHAPERRIA